MSACTLKDYWETHIRHANTALRRILAVHLDPRVVYRMVAYRQAIHHRPEPKSTPFANMCLK